MPSLQELLAQRAELEKQIALLQGENRAAAIAKVRTLMSEFGLSLSDIGGRAKGAAGAEQAPRVPVAAKYRGPAGETWSGRGRQPRWMATAIAAGATQESFKI